MCVIRPFNSVEDNVDFFAKVLVKVLPVRQSTDKIALGVRHQFGKMLCRFIRRGLILSDYTQTPVMERKEIKGVVKEQLQSVDTVPEASGKLVIKTGHKNDLMKKSVTFKQEENQHCFRNPFIEYQKNTLLPKNRES